MGNIPLVATISGQCAVWFQESNQYVIMSPIEAEVLLKIYKNDETSAIKKFYEEKTEYELDDIIIRVQSLVDQQKKIAKSVSDVIQGDIGETPTEFSRKRFYKISNKIFFVEYETAELEFQIHHKFAHLEIENTTFISNHFQVFLSDEMYVLKVDDRIIGQWDAQNLHYLTGKFSMELLNSFYDKTEDDWLAVLHASVISDGENCLLFAGDSGNGKSTAAAILMANNFHLIADDFVPLDTSSEVRFFPAALSVKRQALSVLSEKFPELNDVKEIYFEQLNKTVRYLAPSNDFSQDSYPSKAIIFIKYNKDVSFELKRIRNIEAFQELVPDTWISQIFENVERFMEWFSNIPCYRLEYSNNDEMLLSIKSLFKDEL